MTKKKVKNTEVDEPTKVEQPEMTEILEKTPDEDTPPEPQGDVLKDTEGAKTPDTTKVEHGASIVALEHNYLDSPTLDGRYRLASAFFKGGMVPKSYTSPAAVFSGLELARELRLKPLVGLRNIAVINGHPSVWGDLPLALVRRSGSMAMIFEFIFDKDLNEICFANKNINASPYGAVCRTKRLGDEFIKETWFTMDDAKQAGLLGRDNPWKTYPRRMLQMRARSQNLKDNFSDVLLGISIAEYDFNYMPNQTENHYKGKIAHNGTVVRDVASELNETIED